MTTETFASFEEWTKRRILDSCISLWKIPIVMTFLGLRGHSLAFEKLSSTWMNTCLGLAPCLSPELSLQCVTDHSHNFHSWREVWVCNIFGFGASSSPSCALGLWLTLLCSLHPAYASRSGLLMHQRSQARKGVWKKQEGIHSCAINLSSGSDS